jgi:hypothetical protein
MLNSLVSLRISLKFGTDHCSLGVWVIVTLLPSLLVNTAEDKRTASSDLNVKDYAGWLIWIVGFILESVADHQKSQFRSVPSNKVHAMSSRDAIVRCYVLTLTQDSGIPSAGLTSHSTKVCKKFKIFKERKKKFGAKVR